MVAVFPLLPHPFMPPSSTSAMMHARIVCRIRARCRDAIVNATTRSIRSHLILSDLPDGGPPIPAADIPPSELTVTVTRDWLEPSRTTAGELKEQSIPCGAPMQARDTLPVNPPIGVTASAYEAGLPTETVAEDGDVVNEKPLAPQPRTTSA